MFFFLTILLIKELLAGPIDQRGLERLGEKATQVIEGLINLGDLIKNETQAVESFQPDQIDVEQIPEIVPYLNRYYELSNSVEQLTPNNAKCLEIFTRESTQLKWNIYFEYKQLANHHLNYYQQKRSLLKKKFDNILHRKYNNVIELTSSETARIARAFDYLSKKLNSEHPQRVQVVRQVNYGCAYQKHIKVFTDIISAAFNENNCWGDANEPNIDAVMTEVCRILDHSE